ncbi:MAG TPA: LysM peptidoglycan-binding domain-containing M23 family metallopeptidase [Anaerolineales bacterium]|nr:LysM peptidoglycan-binding domain-containing M23 family metallopeptidase [Anaerolineales bacterium]
MNLFPFRTSSFVRTCLLAAMVLLSACLPEEAVRPGTPSGGDTQTLPTPAAAATPLPTRLPIVPGQIMPYAAQPGDTLEAVAAHFNTTIAAIRSANPALPRKVSTLSPGQVLRVPTYFAPFTGTPFHILPDGEVVNGPPRAGWDLAREVEGRGGYLASFRAYTLGGFREGWQVVEKVAERYSVNPRLLLALLEYRSSALTRRALTTQQVLFPLGTLDAEWKGLTGQLYWASEMLNNGYYGWRDGSLQEIVLADGRVTRPDPWQNAGTVAVQYLLAQWFGQEEFDEAAGVQGFVLTYRAMFGDPFVNDQALIPGDLTQPELALPFEPGKVWAYTGGPHPTWGDSLPWGALDFAPPSTVSGCISSPEWVVAVAEGVVTRSELATVVLDLDGDGDERTGWVVFYFHLETEGRVAQGSHVSRGDHLGHPSCEGGRATGSHVHLARRYNGEWIPAAGPLPFTLSNWVAGSSGEAYLGTLTRFLDMISACTCSTFANQLALPSPSVP